MKKILVLLPILLVSTIFLAGCNTDNTDVSKETQLQQALDSAIERNNQLLEELRQKQEDAIAEGLTQEMVEEDVVPTYEDTTSDVVNNTVTSDFGNQPAQAPGNYVGNTEQLNAYAHSHMVKAHVNGSTMNINLKKAVADAGRNVIVYVSVPGGWHCGGRVIGNEMGDTNGHISFGFDLTNMDLPGTACDGDWFKHIGNKDILVGGYVSSYDGNGFSSVTFN